MTPTVFRHSLLNDITNFVWRIFIWTYLHLYCIVVNIRVCHEFADVITFVFFYLMMQFYEKNLAPGH